MPLKNQSQTKNKPQQWPSYNWQELKPSPVIGVDEVGRGCIAGPVYAAAVIINPKNEYSLYTDSKTLSAPRRDKLCIHIRQHHQVGIGFASLEEIENLNILYASLLAMKRAILELNVNSGHVLVDGNKKVPGLEGFAQTTLVKGDLRASPVAAASIVAKVTRDKLIVKLGEQYPNYQFDKHKGYATSLHKSAIKKWGPCSLHRQSFAGVKEFL